MSDQATATPAPGLSLDAITQRIYLLRGQTVLLDADLAALYDVPTKRFNEQVKRNMARFPADFMFQLSDEEFAALRSQLATSNAPTDAYREAADRFRHTGGETGKAECDGEALIDAPDGIAAP